MLKRERESLICSDVCGNLYALLIFLVIFSNITAQLFRYALLGAASFLGGSMRMTVSLCVIMVEITNNLKLLPLIMLVLLVSKVCLSICKLWICYLSACY